MSRKPSNIKKRDLRVAVETMIQAGVQIARITFGKDGSFTIIAGKPCNDNNEQTNDLDKWMAKHHADETEGH